MARRVHTENVLDDRAHHDDHPAYNLDDLSDDDDGYGEEDAQDGQGAPGGGEGGDDLINYKGIYFNDDPGQKFTCPDTGAHFQFQDMCKRLVKIQAKRQAYDKQMGLETNDSSQNFDPVKVQQLALQKEKEEFLRSLGLQQKPQKETQQKQQQQQQQAQQHQQQQQIAIAQAQANQMMLLQQAEQQMKENNKNLLAQMIIQQQPNIQVQQQMAASQGKWRSKSNEKQSFLNNSQKITNKAKASALVDLGGPQVQKIIGSKQIQQIQAETNMLQRGKTPDHFKNKQKMQVESSINQTQQTIQRLKASLGYNDSTISTSSQQQNQIITNKNRSSQRSNRDKTNANQNVTIQKSTLNTIGSGHGQSHSRNAKGPSGQNTFYKNVTNKSQTMKKGSIGMTSIGKPSAEMDLIMNKFNNSLAIQNIGGYGAATGLVGTSSKSRNVNAGSFKTTASIGSTKGKSIISQTQGIIESSSLKGSTLKAPSNPMIATVDSGNGKKISSSGKYNPNATNQNLYSMIYQNRTKNLVSNYLKGLDGQVRGQQPAKVGATSRNQALNAPAATKKMMRTTNAGGMDGTYEVTSKSLIGRYY